MASESKPRAALEPSTAEHGVWGYDERAVGGFGEDYDAQVAHGDERAEPSGDAGDEALSRAVRSQLAHAHIDAADLQVVVRGGAVTLYGSVHTDAEKAQLEARARAVPGVMSVRSHLGTQTSGLA